MKTKLFFFSAMQLLIPALASAHEGQYDLWPGMMGWGHGMAWPMMIFMFIFWGLVLTGLISLIQSFFLKSGAKNQQKAESAFDILKTRYAKGEIDKEEFEEKKQVIEK